jgi:5-(carboxyamino)imidazole ribonucleotide synthase
VAAAWRAVGGRPSILEEFVAFDREVSLIAVRALDGTTRFWPATENRHVDGILRISRAPARGLVPAVEKDLQGRIRSLLEHLGYVGVVAVEFFVRGPDWIANEMACRVHNSGHWTIEGATTSQFENHLRAIAGLPLGATSLEHPSAMVNLVGRLPAPASVLSVPGAHLHLYGKTPAPGRKLGHVTITARTPAVVARRLEDLVQRVDDPALHTALGSGSSSGAGGPRRPETHVA